MNNRSGHILCTEDDQDSREMLVLFLDNAGYDVTCTDSPAEAIQLIRQQAYDLILVDNWMPEMSGGELTREIRKFNIATPILFYSGAGYDSDKKEARDSGAQGYLVKPQGICELVDEVARLIAEAKLAVPFTLVAPGSHRLEEYELENSVSSARNERSSSDNARSATQRYGSY